MAGQGTEQNRGVLTDARGARPHALVRYGIAVGAVTLALLLTLAFRPLFIATPSPLFFLAIIGSAWYGGARKSMEEALRTSEEQYRRMVETTNEGVWTVNAESPALGWPSARRSSSGMVAISG